MPAKFDFMSSCTCLYKKKKCLVYCMDDVAVIDIFSIFFFSVYLTVHLIFIMSFCDPLCLCL